MLYEVITPVRRFVVGDPEIQQLDLLTGETVTRASVAERLAKAGQVLADRNNFV